MFFFAQSQKRLLKMHLQVAIAGVAEGRDCRRLASQVKLGSILWSHEWHKARPGRRWPRHALALADHQGWKSLLWSHVFFVLKCVLALSKRLAKLVLTWTGVL